jgi:hypothetical protein
MDLGKSFTFMFDDDKWVQKLAIGGLLILVSIIPLVNIFTLLVVTGYTLRLLKNTADGQKMPLPDWDDWGGDWIKGLMIILASLIYSAPIWLVSGFSALLGQFADSPRSGGEIAAVCIAGLSCLSVLWGLAVAVVLPAAIIKYAREGEFGSFFKFGAIFKFIGDNLSNYIVAILLGVVAQFVAGFGVIACIIGVFFTGFWSSLVSSHLLGQVAFEAGPKTMLAAAGAGSMPSVATYGELEEVDFGDVEPKLDDEENTQA